MPVADNGNDVYEVIIIASGKDYAALCPGIPGAVSQGTNREGALNMIADPMAMCRAHPLPGEESAARQEELRALGKARIAELAAECERDSLEYYVCGVAPQLIRPLATAE